MIETGTACDGNGVRTSKRSGNDVLRLVTGNDACTGGEREHHQRQHTTQRKCWHCGRFELVESIDTFVFFTVLHSLNGVRKAVGAPRSANGWHGGTCHAHLAITIISVITMSLSVQRVLTMALAAGAAFYVVAARSMLLLLLREVPGWAPASTRETTCAGAVANNTVIEHQQRSMVLHPAALA